MFEPLPHMKDRVTYFIWVNIYFYTHCWNHNFGNQLRNDEYTTILSMNVTFCNYCFIWEDLKINYVTYLIVSTYTFVYIVEIRFLTINWLITDDKFILIPFHECTLGASSAHCFERQQPIKTKLSKYWNYPSFKFFIWEDIQILIKKKEKAYRWRIVSPILKKF